MSARSALCPIQRLAEWVATRRNTDRPEGNLSCVTCGAEVLPFEGFYHPEWRAVARTVECKNVERAASGW